MFRMRRYRLFLLLAVVLTGTLWHLSRVKKWEVPNVDGLKQFGTKYPATTSAASAPSQLAPYTSAFPKDDKTEYLLTTTTSPTSTTPPTSPPSIPSSAVQAETVFSPSESLGTSSTSSVIRPSSTLKSRPIETDEDREAVFPVVEEDFAQTGQGRLELPAEAAKFEKPKWEPQTEKFPIPSGSIIELPTGRPKSIPKIQYNFATEPTAAKDERLRKLGLIKQSFLHAWTGYSSHSLGHDELTPVSGGSKDPFNGWGATLVDTLDTLWIMGLKQEFEHAVTEVGKIDFKTSARKDIPLFETVIRYLGGLLSAYDLSSGKYPILLDKSVELADILMGAFDTPNRMPVTFYYWTPSYASQPHRAGTRVVLAELGSLSVEFTRLAQITKEAKYYDAIARITDELEYYQAKTTMPGLWPLNIDASGCKKPEHSTLQMAASASRNPGYLTGRISQGLGAKQSEPIGEEPATSPNMTLPVKRQLDDAGIAPEVKKYTGGIQKGGDFASSSASVKATQAAVIAPSPVIDAVEVECEPQRLTNPPYSNSQTYSIGGQADSTYEYLPKQYMLLGGVVDQYQTMYEAAAAEIRNHLLFRPMTKDGRDILSIASMTVRDQSLMVGNTASEGTTTTFEGSHLHCFAGGMFAIGAKIFGLSQDLDTAGRLTDGCIWAYESTTTGIMPESFTLVPCDNVETCQWNETKWWEALDPGRQQREQQAAILAANKKAYEEDQSAKSAYSSSLAHSETSIIGNLDAAGASAADASPIASSNQAPPEPHVRLRKRQVQAAPEFHGSSAPGEFAANMPSKTSADEIGDHVALAPPLPLLPIMREPLTHEEFVKARISEERLPPGFTSISSRKYILRPEAIESVFIMYRITGDEYWRSKGWNMFASVETYTRTDIAHSAINDVTSEVPIFADSMESFWLAETLKYFYLLFSDPSLISLDEYVM